MAPAVHSGDRSVPYPELMANAGRMARADAQRVVAAGELPGVPHDLGIRDGAIAAVDGRTHCRGHYLFTVQP